MASETVEAKNAGHRFVWGQIQHAGLPWRGQRFTGVADTSVYAAFRPGDNATGLLYLSTVDDFLEETRVSLNGSLPLDGHVAFGTPMLIRMAAGAAGLSQGLVAHITRLRDADAATPSLHRSGIGGWRTGDDFLDGEVPVIASLRDLAASAVVEMLAMAKPGVAEGRITRLYGWANLNRPGDYNTTHSHPTAQWSGVYYASIGENDPDRPLSGVIEFQDPRGAPQAQPFPGFDFGHKLRLVPEAGLLLVFPSWLLHMVHPFHGEGERISIAFNATYE
jgi:uncharacterized protein (TIGR02466 family)